LVQDDPKLLDDSGEVPKLNGVLGGSNPGREIVFLLDEKLATWSSTSCVPMKKRKETNLEVWESQKAYESYTYMSMLLKMLC
jgi:hypothetical protein